ncbi:MAG: hypothetical protein ABSB15_22375 [Bryobacteraceae bacterium]|jgi:hypothetical protein
MLPEISFAPSISAPVNWKERLRRAVGSPLGELLGAFTMAPAARTSSCVWYAGIAAEPAEFSRQLADLDLSIVRENRQAACRTGEAHE